MWSNFFKYIDIDPTNVHILDGNAPDLKAECESYEQKIKDAGGVELFIGGIGPDGHIGMQFAEFGIWINFLKIGFAYRSSL